MEMLRKKDVNKLCVNEFGSNALHIAVKKRHFAALKFLLMIKYSVDEVKTNGCTAALIAAFRGYTKILGMLIDHGADISYHTNKGLSAIALAI